MPTFARLQPPRQEQCALTPTTIQSLDVVLGGGLRQGCTHLIAGDPGSGKTRLLRAIKRAMGEAATLIVNSPYDRIEEPCLRLSLDASAECPLPLAILLDRPGVLLFDMPDNALQIVATMWQLKLPSTIVLTEQEGMFGRVRTVQYVDVCIHVEEDGSRRHVGCNGIRVLEGAGVKRASVTKRRHGNTNWMFTFDTSPNTTAFGDAFRACDLCGACRICRMDVGKDGVAHRDGCSEGHRIPACPYPAEWVGFDEKQGRLHVCDRHRHGYA